MFRKIFFYSALLCTMAPHVQAQTQEYAVQLQAAVQPSPPEITLSWASMAGATTYTVYKKQKTATNWGSPIATVNAPATSYTDNGVSIGSAYEYKVEKNGGLTSRGYIYAGIDLPLDHNKGTLLLLVDNTFSTTCAAEIEQLMEDISGDGWKVLRKDYPRTETDVNIRNYIIGTRQSDANLNAVLILGHLAVPYSGNMAPDGHVPDHEGAWPADAYYGEVNDIWTDAFVNNAGATRAENKNIIGDGKWDETQTPGDIELQVSRIDFFDMPTFGKTEEAMMKSYLNRSHAYKMDALPVQKRGLVDDNFGAMGGEAFAANAYRNFPVMVGRDNIKSVDMIGTLDTAFYQWAYGCGGGTYTSAVGVGNTNDFKTKDVNSIFTIMFGSYFGDWASTNNFLRAPLCADVPSLASCWAGRPNWYFHHMALGENIGYATRLTQNNKTGSPMYDPTNHGGGFVHVALMGDLTLRTDYIAPPQNVVLASLPMDRANVFWTASTDPAVVGYYVYRSEEKYGHYERRSELTVGTNFIDSGGVKGNHFYMVRAVKPVTTPSGTYRNMSIGERSDFPLNLIDQKNAKDNITLYPNPASDMLYLSKHNIAAEDADVRITDALGRTLINYKWPKNAGTAAIDISSLSAGTYIAVITSDNNSHSKQWSKK